MERRSKALDWDRKEREEIEAFESRRRAIQAEKKETYQLSDEAAKGGERFSPGEWDQNALV